MRRVLLSLAAAVLVSPFFLLAAVGLYLGYSVPHGLVNLVPVLTGDYLVYDVPVERTETYPTTRYRVVTWRGELEDESLNEASGLAESHQKAGLFYAINDSGNAPVLFALDQSGRHMGSWPLDYDGPHDFEDLATFLLDGKPYVLVADSGDNFRWRTDIKLLIYPEPDLKAAGQPETLSPAWTINFRYPEGFRDCEAVAVDESTEEIFLISKGHIPAEVFRLPLRPETEAIQIAEPVAKLEKLPQPTLRDLREDPVWGDYRSTPTALALRGNRAVVVTYRDAYLYERDAEASWAEVFADEPDRLPLPYINGLESGALSVSGDRLFLVGERDKDVGRMGVYEVNLD